MVDVHERHVRVAKLTEVSDRKLRAFMEASVGKEADVLWEAPTHPDAPMHGFTPNYLRVVAPYAPEMVNTVTRVRLAGLHPTEPESMSI